MKLWVDDERPPPDGGWVWATTAVQAMVSLALKENEWEIVSLDHDLGEGDTGYEVICFIEEEVHKNPNFKCPELRVHSANPVGRARIEQAIDSISRLLEQKKSEKE